MTSLFEPASVPVPPHTCRAGDDPWVWVWRGNMWQEGILWGWKWDPSANAYWGYVDYWMGTRHRMHYVHQDELRPHGRAGGASATKRA